jgi:hypothetical protein
MAFADEIDVKFLQHLNADGGAPDLQPRLLDEAAGDLPLFRSIEIVTVSRIFVSKNRSAGMSLIAGKRLATEMIPLAETG